MSPYSSLIVITGGQQGLGYEAARAIAKEKQDAMIIIGGRASGVAAASTINGETGRENVEYLHLDLADLDSVRKFASQITDYKLPVSALVLNAGIQVATFSNTPAGIETTFGVNHVGHALLFYLLVPFFVDNARVVITASGVHDVRIKSGMPKHTYVDAETIAHPKADSEMYKNGQMRYVASKLCNVLWGYALERRRKAAGLSFTVTTMDPGLMPGTGLVRDAPAWVQFIWHRILPHMLPVLRVLYVDNVHTIEDSGSALARLAVSADVEGVSGEYFEGRKIIQSSPDSLIESKQEELWEWTAEFLGRDSGEAEAYKRLRVHA